MDLDTYNRLTEYLDDLTIPANYDETQRKKLKSKARQYLVRNGLLYKKNSRNSQRPLRVIKISEVELIYEVFTKTLWLDTSDLQKHTTQFIRNIFGLKWEMTSRNMFVPAIPARDDKDL